MISPITPTLIFSEMVVQDPTLKAPLEPRVGPGSTGETLSYDTTNRIMHDTEKGPAQDLDNAETEPAEIIDHDLVGHPQLIATIIIT